MPANQLAVGAVNFGLATLNDLIDRELEREIDILRRAKLVAEVGADAERVGLFVDVAARQHELTITRVGKLAAEHADQAIVVTKDLSKDVEDLAGPFRVIAQVRSRA